MRFLECSGGKAAIHPVLQLLSRGRNDVVVETLDLDLAGARVVKVAKKLHQLRNRIARSSSGFARMRVDRSCLQSKKESEQSAQAGRAGGTVSRYPNRVRNDHGIGTQVWR